MRPEDRDVLNGEEQMTYAQWNKLLGYD